jgi:hypothetical protein
MLWSFQDTSACNRPSNLACPVAGVAISLVHCLCATILLAWALCHAKRVQPLCKRVDLAFPMPSVLLYCSRNIDFFPPLLGFRFGQASFYFCVPKLPFDFDGQWLPIRSAFFLMVLVLGHRCPRLLHAHAASRARSCVTLHPSVSHTHACRPSSCSRLL